MMVASGGALGAVFDVYRVVAGQLRLGRITISALDLMYWIAATIVVFRVLYLTNMGEVRVFVFLGLLLGISIYFALISTYIITGVRAVIRVIRIAASWVVRLFRLLIVRPLLMIYRVLAVLLGIVAATTIFLYKVVIQLLYPVWVFFRWISRPVHKYFLFLTRWRRVASDAAHWVKRMFGRTK